MNLQNAARLRPSWSLLWQTLAWCLIVFAISHDLPPLGRVLNGTSSYGDLGITFVFNCADATGTCAVPPSPSRHAPRPGTPFAAAGVRPGDRIRFDRPYDNLRYFSPGERIGLTVYRGQASQHLVLTAVRRATAKDLIVEWAFYFTGALVSLFVGAFVILRSQQKLSTLLAGMAYVCFSTNGFCDLWQSGPGVWPFWQTVDMTVYIAPAWLFLAFATVLRRETLGVSDGWSRAVPLVMAAAGLIVMAAYMTYTLTARGLPLIGNPFSALVGLEYAAFATALGYLVSGWRRSDPATRQRYSLMLAGLTLTLSARIVSGIVNLTNNNFGFDNPLSDMELFCRITGPLLFAYAVLKNKVLDLGFAVNRTLVYGVVSLVLLVAFGIIEWASERFLPIKNLETNALLDGGIALCIFLVFHRVRDFAEKLIEDVFFRRWRDNEAALKRFVHEAGYIGKRTALTRAFVKELKRFSGGAEVAVYVAGDDRGFVRSDGGLPSVDKAFDGDDPAIVALRANRAAHEFHADASAPAGTLALPMVHRTDLTGFVLLGVKPVGEAYRPDEKEVLAHAAHQIGLDLHALKIEHLEQENATLAAQMRLVRDLGLNPAKS